MTHDYNFNLQVVHLANQVTSPPLHRGPVLIFVLWCPVMVDRPIGFESGARHIGTTVRPRTSLVGPFDRAREI